jgi:hypothetical protein
MLNSVQKTLTAVATHHNLRSLELWKGLLRQSIVDCQKRAIHHLSLSLTKKMQTAYDAVIQISKLNNAL